MKTYCRDFLRTFIPMLPAAIAVSCVLGNGPSVHAISWGISIVATFAWANAHEVAAARNLERTQVEWEHRNRTVVAPWDALSAMGRDQLAKCRAEEVSRP